MKLMSSLNNPRIMVMNNSQQIEYKLSGRFDSGTSFRIRTELMKITETKPHVLIVDMEKVEFMDTCGLGVLISVLKAMRFYGGRLVLHSVSTQAQMLLDLASLNTLFNS